MIEINATSLGHGEYAFATSHPGASPSTRTEHPCFRSTLLVKSESVLHSDLQLEVGMRRTLFLLIFMTDAVISVSNQYAYGDLLFDNGSLSGTQEGRVNAPYTIYDDFRLTAASTVTAFAWTQHDLASFTYQSTKLSILSGAPPFGGMVFFGTFVADRTTNTTPMIFGLTGFDYRVDGLAIRLPAGVYWLGISHNQGPESSGGFTWDQSLGTSSTSQGRYQITVDTSEARFWPNENSAFQVLGTRDLIALPVPEPTSLNLFFTSLVVGVGTWAWPRRRRRGGTVG